MSYLSKVTTGLIAKKDFVLITGPEKVGKTSFACAHDKALLMDLENGSSFIKNIARLPKPENFTEVMAQLNEVLSTEIPYETLVIDTLDFLETMINAETCKENGWASIDEPAFGKGFAAAFEQWLTFIELIKKINEKMHVVLIAHTQIKNYNDPMREPYDRHQVKLRDKIAAKIKESVDAILFCTYEVHVKEANGKGKAIGDGSRVIFTQSRPSHEAGNRYGLPYRLPLDYEAYRSARAAAQPDKPENLMARITEMLPAIQDKDVQKRAREAAEKAKTDAVELSKILNKVETIVAAA